MTEHTVIHTIFFFNDTATTEIYTLSLHDALPISMDLARRHPEFTLSVLFVDIRGLNVFNETMGRAVVDQLIIDISNRLDRKSTRLNSSHQIISYAVFCLKKKTSQMRHILLVRHTR